MVELRRYVSPVVAWLRRTKNLCGGGHVGERGSYPPAVPTFLIRSVVTLRFGRTQVASVIAFVMFKLGLFATEA